MSLYNMMCGMNPAAGRLLAAIRLDPNTIPRFRDVWINKELTEITVHTRTGGGNRPDYMDENAAMRLNPFYLRDADDDFDSTFADFTFRVTEDEKSKLLDEMSGLSPEETSRVMDVITEEPRTKFDKVMNSLSGKNPGE